MKVIVWLLHLILVSQEPIYMRNLELLQTKQLLARRYDELLKEQQARRGGRTLTAVQAATSPQKASPALVMWWTVAA